MSVKEECQCIYIWELFISRVLSRERVNIKNYILQIYLQEWKSAK